MSAQAPHDPASFTESFGGNEWLIDEQYEKFLSDPNSVGPEWREFFANNRPATSGDAATPASNNASSAQAPPRRQQEAAPAKPVDAAPKSAPIQADLAGERTVPDIPEIADPVAVAPTAPYTQEQQAGAPRSAGGDDEVERLRGAAARVVTNMESSLQVPTATSVRTMPAKLIIDNRIVLNNHLARARGGKVSFTHLIGFAVVEALSEMPAMNAGYRVEEDKPGILRPAAVNFGLAIDLPKPDGTRSLLVPSIKNAQAMNFSEFWKTYEEIVKRARDNKLTIDDFMGTTITLTNPGTIGTVHSVPRLMEGQGTIVGVGSMDYPAEYQGASADTLAKLGVSKTLTLTSTYDHRIIQGAQSGEFLRIIHNKLLGKDGFYDRIFAALRVPYEPVRWVEDFESDPTSEMGKPARISELIHAYRSRGHLIADIDPLGYRQRKHPDLDVQSHQLSLWDLDRTFPTGGFGGKDRMKLRDILGLLRDSYCRTIGAEYMHIHDGAQRRWLQNRLESGWAKPSREEQLQILHKLNEAEAFETFLQTKFIGQKRFSLEGSESVIPLLDKLLSHAAREDLDEVAIGMAHRGRLNVLTNIAGKSYGQIFNEFEGNEDPRSVQGSGDVKYHLGTEGTYTSPDGETTKVYLAANPSHLEAVNGVLEGIVRAKQDRLDLGGQGFSVLPLLIHGDAAFIGQGVVAETLNLSQLRGYRTGGTVHVIINNQIGFTTGPAASRSTLYSTDVAKGLQMPIFHVNGDDPEAVAHVAKLAFEYRQEFNRDVVIDLISYRRRGHNEGDDPSMTQPVMYSLIDDIPSVREMYSEALVGRGDITEEEAAEALKHFQAELEAIFTSARDASDAGSESVAGLEVPESQQEDAGVMVGWQTAIDPETLGHIGAAHANSPEGFTVHPKLQQLLERRQKMSLEGGIDWGFGEMTAFGSLLLEGVPVRLAGQDSRRGTFVQRHATFHDHNDGSEWTPLMHLSRNQANFWVYDSALSEYAALAFEYGYSVERPDALVLWEAQFGDFVNGAQTVIDEFISSAEQKWGQRSSVVMLLPHGYEGQGPDHSSGRIERFLQMCAENNMIVAQPSTPANHFHLLRRQAYQRPRRPLIVFSPKQLLRLRAAASQVEDFTTGTFQPVIPDASADPGRVTRLVMCSGRVYYDLAAQRAKQDREDIALVRVEELYPLPAEEIAAEVAKYPNAELVWVQDEPENQGPWGYLALNMPNEVPAVAERGIRVISRAESAAPSAGTMALHKVEQEELLAKVFAK